MIRRERAARGSLARLVAVIAVLVGVVLMHGLQCSDDMTGMHSDGGAGMVHEHSATPANDHDPGPADSDGLGGMLMTCLAFIVVIVTAMVGLRLVGLVNLDRLIRAVRAARAGMTLPRGPSLAQLCLLRT
ncbi:DUF6153 family protein [Kibdelosporangium philippinense]|uniref:DUF6153 family protein n=1 Tax=Kibdelosporangium philippinense TaxID=211113 RepID=A0ABS8ZDH7_9PSEU|nr:DUF6153 family protein [Kibdelosporangium philippinense]MCE7004578.1 DUF6153 family protein [Kibdelosporangium philippinense]